MRRIPILINKQLRNLFTFNAYQHHLKWFEAEFRNSHCDNNIGRLSLAQKVIDFRFEFIFMRSVN